MRPENNSEKMHRQDRLLKAIIDMQNDFIKRGVYYGWCDSTIENLLYLSQSEFGFICELFKKEDGTPYIKSHGITNISWDEQTRRVYEENIENGLEFYNFESLWGKAVTTGEPLISNAPDNDDRGGGYPKQHGHPVLKSFLALPIKDSAGKVVGVIGVANRPNGYDDKMIDFLAPFVNSYGLLIEKTQREKGQKAAEEALQIAYDRLEVAIAGGGLGTWEWIVPTGETLINDQWQTMLGFEPGEVGLRIECAHELTDPEALPRLHKLMQAHLDGKTPHYEAVYRMRHKSGKWVWIHDRGQLTERNSDGSPLRVCGTHADITQLMRAKEEVRQSEKRFRKLYPIFLKETDKTPALL